MFDNYGFSPYMKVTFNQSLGIKFHGMSEEDFPIILNDSNLMPVLKRIERKGYFTRKRTSFEERRDIHTGYSTHVGIYKPGYLNVNNRFYKAPIFYKYVQILIFYESSLGEYPKFHTFKLRLFSKDFKHSKLVKLHWGLDNEMFLDKVKSIINQ